MQKQAFSASIVIPCYNSSKTILLALASLEKQSTKPLEVIVVDDGSNDSTLKLLANFKKKTKLNLKILKQNHAGPAMARNLGAKSAKSDVIVFFDSDCIAPTNWLQEMLVPLQHGYFGISCPYQTRNTESLIARYVGFEIAQRHEKILGKAVDGLGSYSLAFLKKAFFEIGGFDTSFKRASGEDFALTFAMHARGKKLFFTDKTFVYHFHPSSLIKFLRQQFWRGYWRVPLYLKNKSKIVLGESYSGFGAHVQFSLSLLFLLSIPATIHVNNIFLFLVALALLLLSNLSLGFWCIKKEKKMFLVAPLIASLRSLSGTLGGIAYLLDKIGE